MSVQIPPYPISTGDTNKDIRNLLKWVQSVSQHPNFLAIDSNPAIGHALSVRPAASPLIVQMSDEILYVTVSADHDTVMLPLAASANINRMSRKYTFVIVGGVGGINLSVSTGLLNGSSSPYYLSGAGSRVSVTTDGTNYWLI